MTNQRKWLKEKLTTHTTLKQFKTRSFKPNFCFNSKKTENTTTENKKKFLLIKNSTNQNRSNSKTRQPIIMLKKKSVDQSVPTKLQYDNDAENEPSNHMANEPTQSDGSPHKMRKVSQSSSSVGGMSPDSGWGDSYSSDSSSDHVGGSSGHSDSNSSEPSSPVTYDIPQTPMTHHQHHAYTTGQQSPSPSSPTQPEVKADMSNYIEQAFQFSMGMKPEVKTEVPEIKSEPIDPNQYPKQPIESPEPPTQTSQTSYESSTSYNSPTPDVFDIFGDVNVDISYSKTAPPWEELDIEIEPCFKNNITPFYFN